MIANHPVQVKEESVGTLHFDSQAFTDSWKTMIEKPKKFVFIISKRAKNSRDFRKRKNPKTEKTQEKKKEKKEREKEEKEEEEMEMQAHGLLASHRG